MIYFIFRLIQQYNKNGKHWTVVKEREARTYPHINGLKDDIVQENLSCTKSVLKSRETQETLKETYINNISLICHNFVTDANMYLTANRREQ